MVTFKNGNIYNFNTNYGAVLGSSFKNMYLEATCGFDYAVKFADVVTIYKQIQDLYHVSDSSDVLINLYKNDMYYVFRAPDKSTKVFASTWIDIDSIMEVKTKTLNIEIKDFTGLDYSKIEKALNDLGYRNFSISTSGYNDYSL